MLPNFCAYSILLSGVIFLISIVSTFEQKPEQNEPFVVSYLGTKTPYRVVANVNDSIIEYPGCFSKKIFGVVRHGTRTPGDKAVNKVKNIVSALKLRRSEKDIASYFNDMKWKLKELKDWSSILEIGNEKVLTAEGEREMFWLGRRFQNRFPNLMPKVFTNSSYFFKYTDTQRTRESARNFALGIFGEKGMKNVWFPQPSKRDPILRFYKLCDKWTKEVKKNSNSKLEFIKYKSTDEVHKMLEEISHRMDLNYSLSFDSIHLIFIACAFRTAWEPKYHSPWCNLFKKKDLEVLEYYEELKYYWRDGYGFDINYKQACPLVQKAMNFFLDKDKRKSIFYFTHSGTLLKILSYIGLYKDDFKLAHDTDQQLRDARNWRVSKMNSFGNNLVFVLFECEDGEKLLTLHQERPVRLAGCPAEDLCPLSIVRKIMPSSQDHECNFNSICSL